MSLSPQVCKKSYKVKIPTLGENCEFWLITVTDESGITNPNKDHAYLTDSGKLYIYNGKTLIQVNCDICFTQEERDKLEGIEEGANKYVLPVATDNALGGIKTGFTQTEKQYAVEVTEEGQAYVTVPWTDTVYTLPVADTDTLGGVKLGYSQNGKNYPVVKDSEGNIYVAVPWEEYSLPQAETNTLGGIKTGYEQQGQNYPVLVDVDGNAYVNVPWTYTDTKYNVVSTTENGLAPMLPSDENASKRFLNGDGEWVVGTDNSINGVTQIGSSFSGETSDCGVEITKVVGKTVQQTTNGYQLFDASKLPTTSAGGATVTNNNDGSFTISGSGNLTGTFSNLFNYSKEESLKLLKVGTYKSNTENTTPQIRFGLRNASTMNYVSNKCITGSIKSITLTEEDIQSVEDGTNVLSIGFYGSNNNAIVTGTVKPMIYIDGDGTFEEFTGGQPAPNPDYAIPIQNVEISEIKSTGKNVLPFPYLFGDVGYKTTQKGITFECLSDKGIKISGTATDTVWIDISDLDYGNKYFNTNIANDIYSVKLFDENNTGLFIGYNSNNKITSINIYKDETVDTIVYPMISKGEISDYEAPKGYNTVDTSLTLAQDDIYQQGTITRARKQVVFDGSSDEGWSINVGNVNGYFRTFIDIPDCSKIDSDSLLKIKCNRFATEPSIGYWINPTKNAIVNVGSSVNGRIAICFDGVSTVDEWKSWLQSHPLKIEYPLLTPTTEEFKVPTIPSYYPFTNVSTDSEVEPEITFMPLPYTTCLVGEATEEESGYMPPLSGNSNEFLNGNGEWSVPSGYTLPTASSSTLGGVKIGENITISSGTISLTKANVVSALGYTPPTTNTTYSLATTSASGLLRQLSGNTSQFLNGNGQWATPPNTTYGVATTSTNGLMSATDKSRLDQLWAKFDSMVFFTED